VGLPVPEPSYPGFVRGCGSALPKKEESGVLQWLCDTLHRPDRRHQGPGVQAELPAGGHPGSLRQELPDPHGQTDYWPVHGSPEHDLRRLLPGQHAQLLLLHRHRRGAVEDHEEAAEVHHGGLSTTPETTGCPTQESLLRKAARQRVRYWNQDHI